MGKVCKTAFWLLVPVVLFLLCTTVGFVTTTPTIDEKFSGPIHGPLLDESTQQRHFKQPKDGGTELIPDPVSTVLLVSTLDGSLTALDRLSGQVRWVSKDEPMIRVPTGGQSPTVRPPYFLPDPKSGELYILGRHRNLKKLPFTIPQLVSMSPCRSSEGLLYTGKKLDMWLNLNPLTGEKSQMSPNSHTDSTCPAQATSESGGDKNSAPTPKAKPLLIGKSEYTISMMDGPRKWNVTFHDYSSVDMNGQSLQDYDLVHFTSPSTGAVLTYERESGQLLWQSELDTPVIALYTIDCSLSTLTSVPFQSVAVETLNRLKVAAHDAKGNNQLSPTLYVGECPYGLYAVPSLVDDTVLPISGQTTELPYLIEGPSGKTSDDSIKPVTEKADEPKDAKDIDADILLLGHYEVPNNPTPTSPPNRQITAGTPKENVVPGFFNESESDPEKIIPPDEKKAPQDAKLTGSSNAKSVNINPNKINFPPLPATKLPVTPRESPPPIEHRKEKPYLIVTTAVVTTVVTIAIISLGYVTVTRMKKSGHERPVSSGPSSQKSLSKDEERDQFPDGEEYQIIKKKSTSADGSVINIGKISFEPGSVLGKGCEGTFVYKGKFEKRDVAVKRILPECFAFADREVDLLKESDQHANVIRYFCTESDGQFRYIALELCSATLNDWVDGKFSHDSIQPLKILREATDGLAHLHSLSIVHRDIKPANVLLTICSSTRKVRTMISDFGLCKKLANGRTSFSRRSGGIPGTDGWIAPEVVRNLNSQPERMTHSVDIFSLGCVFYYVLTKGDHPFGDPFRRQSNILSGDAVLDKVSTNPQGVMDLITVMISSDSSMRPPLAAILEHPMFWSEEKILSFFLDVSDRIEKENESTCLLLQRLEMDGEEVVRKDWRDHICSEVAMDLRRYRTYKGHSVRDLLRALRNKKNHYRELTQEAQASLGQIPNQFVLYWLTRFPRLLPYTWEKFECVKSEPIFAKYYSKPYCFFVWSMDCDENEFENQKNSDIGSQNENSPTHKGIDGDWRSDASPERTNGSPQKPKLDKHFWKSKSQYKYNKWRRQQNNLYPSDANTINSSPNRVVPAEKAPSAFYT